MQQSSQILIADDHPLMRGALRQAVHAAEPGAGIHEASDYDGIVKALAAERNFDLVLLDLSMPGVRGYSGLMFLRAERPELPIIVVSANEERAVMSHCLEFGAAAFMPKSLSAEKCARSSASSSTAAIGARRRSMAPMRPAARPAP